MTQKMDKIKRKADSAIGINEDRKLAFSFGALVLAIMVIVTATGASLYTYQQITEENRLSTAVAGVIGESISKVSFSGKYHTRLFVEDIKTRVPDLESVSVETFEGDVIASSDPSYNDTNISDREPAVDIKQFDRHEALVSEHEHGDITVKEIIIPLREGLDNRISGIIRISINVEKTRWWLKLNLAVLIMLITALSSAAIWIILRLSRHFGSRVRNFALQMQTVLDNSPALIYMKDFEGRYLFINKKWAELFDTSNDNVRGKTDLDLFPEDIAGKFISNDRYVMDKGELLETEEYAPLPDGLHRYQSTKVAIRDSNGNIYALCGISTDITERKKSEEALIKSEEQYRFLLDFAPDPFFHGDSNGNFINVNNAALELTGYTKEELLRMNMRELFPPDVLNNQPLRYDLLTQGETIKNERTLRQKNGGLLTIEMNSRKMPDGTYQSFFRDITRRKQAENELRASEEKFKNLVEQSPYSIQIMDTSGKIIQINDAFTRMWGLTLEEVEGYNILDDKQLEELGVMDSIKKGFSGVAAVIPPIGYNAKGISNRGNKRWTKANIYPVKDDSGSIRNIVLTHDDITDQRAAEDALRETEEIFSHFMENSPIYVFFKDQEIRSLRLSKNYEQMLGMPLENILGKTMDELFPSDLAKSMIEDDKRVLNHGEVVTVDEELNGRYYTTIKFPIFIDKQPRYLAGYTIDITERILSERMIDAERERLLVTLRSIGDAVITTDVEGRIVLMNRVAEELTGWSLYDAQGHPLMEVFKIINEATREPGENPADRVLQTGNIIELPQQTILISRDGSERLIADSGAPILASDSTITGIVLVFRDVTEKRNTENLLQNSQKLESLGVLAGGIAHDFNNLLSGIFGYMELMKIYIKKGDTAKLEETLEKALQVFGRTKALTQQLLTFARGGEPHRKNIHLARMLVSNTQFVLSGTKVNSMFNINPDLWHCYADENQIAQVIDNLIINAVQAMPGGGIITINADNFINDEPDTALFLYPGRYIRISISDQGHGIPKEHLPRIFDPFYTTKTSGTGLGLATSYSIMKRHGGAIRVDSTEGRGSTFTLYIPASERDLKIRPDFSAAECYEFSGRLLVMDDEEFIRNTAADMLSSKGIEADTAENGDTAADKYREAFNSGKPYKAVILDLTVKGGTGGREALRMLKELDPDVIAIASSGYSADPVMANPMDYGFRGRLIKPYRLDELMTVLSRIMKD